MAPLDLPFLRLIRARGKLYPYYRRRGVFLRLRADPNDPGALAAAWRVAHEAWESRDREAETHADKRRAAQPQPGRPGLAPSAALRHHAPRPDQAGAA